MQNRMQQTPSARPKGKASQAQSAFVDLLAEVNRSGYYGSVSLNLTVQDGHIQHVRVATERLIR